MANTAAIKQDMTTGNLPQKLLAFSVPLILSNLLQQLYNLVDVVIVGQFMNSAGLSGVSNGADIQHIVSVLAFCSCTAGQVVIAQYLGKGDRNGVKKTIGTLFSFMTLLSFVVMILGFLSLNWLLNALNVPAEAYEYAKDYCIVCYIGSFFIFGYNMVASVLRGMGDSRHPLIFVAIAALTNLLLDLLFVAVLGFGTRGAALATVIGQSLSFLISLIYLFHKRDQFGFDFRKESFRIHSDILISILRLGLPMALHSCAVRVSKLYLTSYINSYGVTVSAVNGIGNKLSNVSNVVMGGLDSASTTVIGQNFGADNKRRVRQSLYLVIGLDLFVAAIMSLIVLLFPEQIFALFSNDPKVLEAAHSYAPILIIGFFAYSLRGSMQSFTTGIGHASLSMASGILDGVVARIGLGLFLGLSLGWGIYGFWYGDALAGFVPFIVGGVYFWSGMWEKRKLAVSSKENNYS